MTTTNCKISLLKFQTQINFMYDAFKSLMPDEQEEAIYLIYGFYSRSLMLVFEKCNISDVMSKIDQNDLVLTRFPLVHTSDPTVVEAKSSTCDSEDVRSLTKISLQLLEKKDVTPNEYQVPESLFKDQVADVNLASYMMDIDKCNNDVSEVFSLKSKGSSSLEEDCSISLSSAATTYATTASAVGEKELSIVSTSISDSSLLFEIGSIPEDVCHPGNPCAMDCLQTQPEPIQNAEQIACVQDIDQITKSSTEQCKNSPTIEEMYSIPSTTASTSSELSSGVSYSTAEMSLAQNLDGSPENKNQELELSCWFCRLSFPSTHDFKGHTCQASVRHIRNSSQSQVRGEYKCLPCDLAFGKFKSFMKHLADHQSFTCQSCHKVFSSKKQLTTHLKDVHSIVESQKNKKPPQKYKCRFCDQQYCKRSVLNLHMKKHSDGKEVCLKCGEMFEDEAGLTEHMKQHEGKQDFFCKSCNQYFARRQQYEQHMTAHERHVCSACNVSFSTKKLWSKHQHDIHGERKAPEKKHKCPICIKSFQRPMHLRLHQRVHTGEKPILCPHCKKSFCTKRALVKHQKTESHMKKSGKALEVEEIEKPFLCAVCGFRFFRRQSLQRHMEFIHSSSEYMNCPHCEYKTRCKANYKRHVAIHTETKPYVCEICASSFHALATLNEHHAYLHSEKRAFACTLCSKSFKGNGSLKRHMKNHSEDRPYKCHCAQSYKRMSHLKRHMASVHNAVFDSKKLKKLDDPIEDKQEVDLNVPTSNVAVTTSNSLALDMDSSKVTTSGLSMFFDASHNFTMSQQQVEMLMSSSSDYEKVTLNASGSLPSNFIVIPTEKIDECLNRTTIRVVSDARSDLGVEKSTLMSLLDSQVKDISGKNITNALQVGSLGMSPSAYQTISIPVTTSDMAAIGSVPPEISHLLSPSTLVTQSPSSVVSCSSDGEFIVPISTFSDASCGDLHKAAQITIPQFLMNVDVPPQSLESVSGKVESCPKPLFDISSAFVDDLPPYSAELHSSGKDQTSLSSNPHGNSLVWVTIADKLKTSDTIAKDSPILTCPSSTISTSLSSSSFNMTNSVADVFSTSIMFSQDDDPDCTHHVEDFDPLFSQAYAEDVKQLLSMS